LSLEARLTRALGSGATARVRDPVDCAAPRDVRLLGERFSSLNTASTLGVGAVAYWM